MEQIKRIGFNQPDRQGVEDDVIAAVQRDPEHFLRGYLVDPHAFDGRYVASDLFKEQFEQYALSRFARERYCTPVHNASAVLASEQFRRVVADGAEPMRDTVVFLTGIPGAGKTTAVLENGKFPASCRAIYEGQLARPQSGMEKIQCVLDAGCKAQICVIHTTPESALDNTLSRFNAYGRGASINTMAGIMGYMPDGLDEIHRRFGDAVTLHIMDYRDRSNPTVMPGWYNLDILRSEGNHEHIKHRLENALDERRSRLSVGAWRQAKGLAPPDFDYGMGTKHAPDLQALGGRLGGRAVGDSGPPVLTVEKGRVYRGPVLATEGGDVFQLTATGIVRHERETLSGAQQQLRPGGVFTIRYPYERVGFVREVTHTSPALGREYYSLCG